MKLYYAIEYATRYVIGRLLCRTGRHNVSCPRGTSKAIRHITAGRYAMWDPLSHRHYEYLQRRWPA